jgi:5-methylthioribose kinase
VWRQACRLRLRCRAQLVRFQNADICALTEQVIFTDPYYLAPANRHTAPQLDGLARTYRYDTEARAAATALKVMI